MLELKVKAFEAFDETHQEFIKVPSTTLRLEHSLVSLSKWEAKWKVPFFSERKKSSEQLRDYIRCMAIGQNINPNVFIGLSASDIKKVQEYIAEEHTATTFSDTANKFSSRIVTSELIYYWMTVYNVPFECQKWNLSRLLTLLRIASIENAPKKKIPTRELMDRNRALNRARRKARHTKG